MGIGIGFDFIGVTNVEHNITLYETFMMFLATLVALHFSPVSN